MTTWINSHQERKDNHDDQPKEGWNAPTKPTYSPKTRTSKEAHTQGQSRGRQTKTPRSIGTANHQDLGKKLHNRGDE